MSHEYPPDEVPEDEMVSVPLFSAKVKRILVASSLVITIGLTVRVSSHQVGRALSLLFASSAEQVPVSGIIALSVLAVVTAFSILLSVVIWRHMVSAFREPGVLREICGGVGVLFGFLVLSAWIPYLMIWPLALSAHLAGSGDFPVVTGLEIWVLFCAPFLVGFVSSKRIGRPGPSLVAAVFTILVSSVVYVQLIDMASPPLLSSQMDVMRRQAEELLGQPSQGGVVIVMCAPFFRYPMGMPSIFMLISIIAGLGISYSRHVFGKRRPRTSARGILVLFTAIIVLLVTSWFVLVPRGGVEEITVVGMVASNLSSRVLESWVEPADFEMGGNLSIYFRMEQGPAPFEFTWQMIPACRGVGGGGRNWAEIDRELMIHTIETSKSILRYTSPDQCMPVVLCYITCDSLSGSTGLMGFWTTVLPNESLGTRALIEPCLYQSRLAFKIDPSLKPDRVTLLYFETNGRHGARPLRRVIWEKEGIFKVEDLRRLPKSMRSPKQLGIWDPEDRYLEYDHLNDQTVFLVVAFKGEEVIVSDVFVPREA